MKRPGDGSSSTARRTRSQLAGTRCHSSSSTGGSPLTSRRGSAWNSSSAPGASSAWTVRARRRAVTVLPTPFAPRVRAPATTAGARPAHRPPLARGTRPARRHLTVSTASTSRFRRHLLNDLDGPSQPVGDWGIRRRRLPTGGLPRPTGPLSSRAMSLSRGGRCRSPWASGVRRRSVVVCPLRVYVADFEDPPLAIEARRRPPRRGRPCRRRRRGRRSRWWRATCPASW